MPGAVPFTSTYALTNVTSPYALAIADQGVQAAVATDPVLAAGLTTAAGKLISAPVGAAHELPVVAAAEAFR
jgi:alanine dehydrogenase